MAAKKSSKKVELPATIEELQALGQEMNEIIFPDEPVDYSEMEPEALVDQLKTDMEEVTADDEFSPESIATLQALGCEVEFPEVSEDDDEEESGDDTEKGAEDNGEVTEDMSIEEILEVAKSNKISVPPPFRKSKEKLVVYVNGKLAGGSNPAPEKKKGGAKRTTPAKKVTPAKKPAPVKKEVDKFGFRPGCKKSKIMELIAVGKSKMEDLLKEFGGQVAWAIKETKERTGTVVVEDSKGFVKIEK